MKPTGQIAAHQITAQAAPGMMPAMELLARGRHVIQAEADALDRLALTLDARFADAVNLLLATQSRVVVSGMGKSGHVGRKLAATLAATGTPAFFVHPAEAAHGDLGMMTAHDALLVLSNSGNTPDLRQILAHAAQLGCPVIGICGQPDSVLMRAATVGLVLPPAREACPANIAPTTSSTLMLALGDALAIATMAARGVTHAQLRQLHPGGSIGLGLVTVGEIMHRGEALPLVPRAMPMREVLLEMTEKSLGIAGVVDRTGRLLGAITDGDLRRHVHGLLTARAEDVMTPAPRTVRTSARAGEALALMSQAQVSALFVVEDHGSDLPVGVLHLHDLGRLGLN
ncbi:MULTISPECIES: KpsF/GutQ family sugar-phosphate isomerase [unclassified Novosphingobium]|uniref:KpsF/GutQ family sugar-phosphate isomerase n=2 Tax=Novosphingobium TaxID=165696 RepID=UPI00185A6F2C|nr:MULTISPECIES: KpsF/GutQ family sugar-phosphate isomerase [unclassified Novosphingobium]NMN07130.1 arabinose-5-phosphate isomerase [Novosphingobium sp. SG919]NMN89282.1 arabinose-5-phosphate isomerase [Novosphingobium sp. SG916]